ncbi:MAG: LPS export ABC transporter permease LptG [Gammaproteobacteria bacterium]|nr:LPS export ABC transporter permease LptG [Gammaproteobacteria bacterium]
MNHLTKYLAGATLTGAALVLMALLAISMFLGFLGELDHVGKGNYSLGMAFLTVLLEMPALAYEMLPLAALIGGLMGLGALASGSELIVMSAAGMSLWSIGRAVALAGTLLASAAFVLGDWVAPWASLESEVVRYQSISGARWDANKQDIWFRDGNRYVNVSKLAQERVNGRITTFDVDSDGKFSQIAVAASADIEGKRWFLNDWRGVGFRRDEVLLREQPRQAWDTSLTPEMINLFAVAPQSFSSYELFQYVRYLHDNRLDASVFEQALWRKAVVPVSIVLMCLLALPFVMGPLRDSGSGQRLVTGVVIGVVYFLANQLFRDSAQLYGLSPLFGAWGPTAVLAVITAFSLRFAR